LFGLCRDDQQLVNAGSSIAISGTFQPIGKGGYQSRDVGIGSAAPSGPVVHAVGREGQAATAFARIWLEQRRTGDELTEIADFTAGSGLVWSGWGPTTAW